MIPSKDPDRWRDPPSVPIDRYQHFVPVLVTVRAGVHTSRQGVVHCAASRDGGSYRHGDGASVRRADMGTCRVTPARDIGPECREAT